MKQINREYESKRGSKRLPLPRIHRLPPNSVERVRSERIARGMGKAGQYKDVYLTRKPQLIQILEVIAAQ